MGVYDLSIQDLTKSFKIGGMIFGSHIVAVDHVNLEIRSDKPWIMAIVGESGSGKSTLAKIVLKLLEANSGEVRIGDESLSVYDKKKKEFRRMVQPIFQNPFTAFSARRPVDSYLYETAYNLGDISGKEEATERMRQMLEAVGMNLDHVAGKYPNQFSGGELQRICRGQSHGPQSGADCGG